jgi:hypothetical protein
VFSAQIESEDRSLTLDVTTYSDEVADLLAGKSQAVVASDHKTRSIVVNAATIYITRGGDTFYATGGTLTVAALPSEGDKPLHMDVDVTVKNFSTQATSRLTGSIDATYIGTTRSSATHACPQLPDVPKGLIF